MSRRRRVLIRVAISVVSALFMAGLFASMGDAGALVARSGSVVVRVRPTSRVADGQAIAIRAVSATGIEIYQLRAHLCSAGAPVRTNFDFGFQGRRCANVALGRGDIEKTVEYGSGVNTGELDTFHVGVGNVRWVNELGYDQVLDCGPGHPCDLVVRVQITDDTLFFNAPLCYGAGCPAEPADGALIPSPTTTSTTVHPPAPAHVPTPAPTPGAPAPGTPAAVVGSASRPARQAKPSVPTKAATKPALCVPAGTTGSGASTKTATDAKATPTAHHGLSQDTRMLLAALAGAVGSAWIVSIFLRGRALLLPLFTRHRGFHPYGELARS